MRLNRTNSMLILWTLLLTTIAIVVGCHHHDKIYHKTIQELYNEAVDDAARRPDVIQPTFHAHTSEFAIQEKTISESHSKSILDVPREEIQGRPPEVSRPAIRDQLDFDFDHHESSSSRRLPKLNRDDKRIPSIVTASYQSSAPNDRVSEIFEQTDIREAIQILATAAGQSVVIDETVGGVTSAQIENETFDKALEKVLLPLGLVYARHEGKYLVAPPDPDSPLYSFVAERSQYSPNYHDVARLTSLLPPRFKPFFHLSAERNLIVVDAPPSIGMELVERLQELDQPVPQVELEAIVCVVLPDSGFRFGLDWGHVVGVDGVDSLKAGFTGLAFSGSASRAGFENTFSDFAVTSAFIKLLAQEGYVTIRAAPRVTARDGEKASIAINREAFFSLQPTTSNVFFQQTIQKVDSGITLEITPRVHGDMVSVNISKAEVSEDIRTNESRAELTSNPFPIINRRVVSTQVNVRDGHTIVIGGLVQSQTVDRVNKVPGLSRIPLVGNLFKTIDKQKQDAEVAIFISPRVIPIERSCVTP